MTDEEKLLQLQMYRLSEEVKHLKHREIVQSIVSGIGLAVLIGVLIVYKG